MRHSPARAAARLIAAAGVVVALLAAPAVVAAHGLSPAYSSPLPLAVYLVGAAAVVGLSFVFVLARDVRAAPAPPTRPVPVPRAAQLALRAVGLIGWGWIVVQGVAGGTSDASVASLFLWVYGWVGVAVISALGFPIWEWLDPFTALFDIGRAVLRRLGVHGWTPSGVPVRARGWPAVVGFGFFVWLELVVVPGTGALTLVLVLYTLLTLGLMAQTGREAWRANGETFSVWFRALNRLAPYGLAENGSRINPNSVVRRPFATGLLDAAWPTPRIVLIGLAVASIIFDGLSQTTAFASVFGAPGFIAKTVLLAAFLALVVGAALVVARTVSNGAIGAGLLPIAVGYLIAHYLTYLLIDGQRIVIAVSDPLQTGADLLGTAFYQVQTGWLPPGLVWTLQLAAVVGGHMVGAWAGHVTAQREWSALARSNGRGKEPRDMRHRKIHEPARSARDLRFREVPLALVMVALSVLTLWSLGQSIVKDAKPSGASPAAISRAL
jgi:hypothetical protein